MAAAKRIGWVVQSRSFDIASVRYRCHYPAYALSLSGHSSEIFDDPAKAAAALPDLDLLIILKRLDAAMIPLAARAREQRTPVILDLCDDIFSPGYRGDAPDMNLMVLAALATAADLIVTTGPALSERVRNALPLWTPLTEIPDVDETPALLEAARAHFAIAPPSPPSPPATEGGWARTRRRLKLCAGHPAEAWRRLALRVQRHPLSIQGHQQMGRMLYVLRHPDWAAARASRGWRRSPLRGWVVRTSGRLWFRARHPVGTARKLRHGLLTSRPGLALRQTIGRTAYVLRHPGWLAARIVRAPATVHLRRGWGRFFYAAARPRWAARKAVHAALVSRPGTAVRVGIARAAYGLKRPGWLLRRTSHAVRPAVVSVRTVAGRAVWLARRPRRALAKGMNGAHHLLAAAFRLRRRIIGPRTLTAAPPRPDVPLETTPAAVAVATPAQPARARVVWFGNHGGPHSNFGMLSLLASVRALRQVHADYPFELVLVSSDRGRFDAFLRRSGLDVRFVAWTAEAVHRELAGASAALLTTGDDRFSRVKSANRAVLALSAGVPVVATASPALEPLRDVIATDVARGLRAYLADPERGAEHVRKARAIIDQLYGVEAVKAKWEAALEGVARRAQMRRARRRTQPKICILVDLIQDLDILLPVVDRARARGLVCNLVVSEQAAADSARVVESLIARQIIPTSLTSGALSRLDARWLRDADVLITAAESSLAPHAAAHGLARLANRLGLRTACIQHGYEAPGLTFQLPEPPTIASQVIFTWSDPKDLPAWTPADVRARAVGVGRPRPAAPPPPPAPRGQRRTVVGVFENLHWERYSQEYRLRFLDQLLIAAQDRPDLLFEVRPHPAGRWFLRRGPALRLENVVVVEQDLDGLPVETVMAGLDAVITTPSTIALDACVAGRPVAVVGGDLTDLGAYQPLPVLRELNDWSRFLQDLDGTGWADMREAFVRRASLPGDAAERILDHLCGETWPPCAEPLPTMTARPPPATGPQPTARTAGDLAPAEL